MSTTTLPMFRNSLTFFTLMGLLGLFSLASLMSLPCRAQEETDQASVSSTIGRDGTGTFIVEAHGQLPEPPVFYTASAKATACLLYTSPSPRDRQRSRMPSSA